MTKKELQRTVDIPSGVQIDVSKGSVKVSGPKGEIERSFYYPRIGIRKEDSKLVIYSQLPRRREVSMVGTFASRIDNMVKGVIDGYEYVLKVVYTHFPVSLKIQKNHVLIENFVGERDTRKSRIMDGTKVDIKGDTLIVSGLDRESVGQTAANLENATRIKRRDPRVFQDGIYIVEEK